MRPLARPILDQPTSDHQFGRWTKEFWRHNWRATSSLEPSLDRTMTGEKTDIKDFSSPRAACFDIHRSTCIIAYESITRIIIEFIVAHTIIFTKKIKRNVERM